MKNIFIKNVGENNFLARYVDNSGNLVWQTDAPMTKELLCKTLHSYGAHARDIYDELAQITSTKSASLIELKNQVDAQIASGIYDKGLHAALESWSQYIQ